LLVPQSDTKTYDNCWAGFLLTKKLQKKSLLLVYFVIAGICDFSILLFLPLLEMLCFLW
jgi:hypothetical protein